MIRDTKIHIFRLSSRGYDYKAWQPVAQDVELVQRTHPMHATFKEYAERHPELKSGRYLMVPATGKTHVAVESDLTRCGIVITEVAKDD